MWTASHLGLPLLIVVANNRSYFNDERHQERVARTRGRPVENRWIGQRLTEPEVDIVAMARAQGFGGIGPVTDSAVLDETLTSAADRVAAGGCILVDVRTVPGYAEDNK